MLKIQGLSAEIEQLSHDQHVPTRHRCRLTLVDLSLTLPSALLSDFASRPS